MFYGPMNMTGPYANAGRNVDRFGNPQKLVRIYNHVNAKTGFTERRGFFKGAGNKLYKVTISDVRNPKMNNKGEDQCNWVAITEVKPMQGQARFNPGF